MTRHKRGRNTGMNATQEKLRQQMRVEAFRSRETPDYMIMARHLLPKIRAFYEDPENEKAFQEWKAEREKKEAKH